MPKAQRTKSAGHEALQRRASERPGDGFSEKLAAPATKRSCKDVWYVCTEVRAYALQDRTA
jgi:hypothetical protein